MLGFFKGKSISTKSACFPTEILPTLSYIPISFAGFSVAHITAVSNEIPAFLTTYRRQSIKLVADPAIVPSCNVARLPFTTTGCPPRVYSPSSHPVALMLSLISIMRPAPNIANVARITDG